MREVTLASAHCKHLGVAHSVPGTVVVQCGLWLATSSLHGSRLVSKDSLSVSVAVLLASAAPLYKMVWAPHKTASSLQW